MKNKKVKVEIKKKVYTPLIAIFVFILLNIPFISYFLMFIGLEYFNKDIGEYLGFYRYEKVIVEGKLINKKQVKRK